MKPVVTQPGPELATEVTREIPTPMILVRNLLKIL